MRKSHTTNLVCKKIIFLFVGLIFCAITLQAQVATQRPAKIVQKPLPQTRYIPTRSVDIQHIKLDLRFDFEKEAVKGSATITFSPLRSNLEQVEFDAANMSFSSVKFEKGMTLKFEDDDAKEKIRIKLDKAYQPTEILIIIIEYQTDGAASKYNKRAIAGNGGLVFVKPDSPNSSRQIWSQGEAEWNHFWFPCYDHPNDFSTTEMIATVEKPHTVISNGRLIEQKENNDNTRTFHWKIEQPHASYLVSIVVGEFEVIEDRSMSGVPVVSYVPKNKVNEARTTVARVPKMIDFFESYMGVKFPFVKYGQVFARKFNGGMENITATTLEEEAIIDDRTAIDRTSDDLLSHELAHSWFGNYVTSRSWSELWLNESFATYFEQLWTENYLGHDEALYSDLRANQENYFRTWQSGIKRPIVTRNYKDPDAVFDTYSYPRGASVLHILRKVLGEDDWKRAINYYLKKHAHQPVGTEEFRVAIEESTGQPLEWFFEQWVYKMGHPVFDVTQTYDAANKKLKLKVRQTQKQDQSFSYPQATYFQTPVEIEIAVSNGELLEKVFIEPVAEQEFVFAVNEKPLFVNFDYESTLIKELNFPKPIDELIAQLQRDRDVLGRLFALKEMQKILPRATRVEKEKIVNAIVASLSNDKFWGIRRASATALRGLDAEEKVRTALIAATKDKNSAVRVAAVVSLSSVKGVSISNVYLQLLNDASYDVVDAATTALGSSKSSAAYDALIKLAGESLNTRIRISALRGLAELDDVRALELGISLSSSEDMDVQDEAISLVGRLLKQNQNAFVVLSKYLEKVLAEKNNELIGLTIRALMSLKDRRAIPLLEKAKAQITDSESRYELEQFIESLRKEKSKP